MPQKQLQTCQRTFEANFHAAVIGKAIVSITGHCVEVNASFAAMLGFSQAELAGMHFSDFTHPLDTAVDLHLFESVMRGERDSYQLEKRYVRRDGSVIDVLLSAICVRGHDGVPIHFVSEVVDLTDRNQTRRELQEANAKLQLLVVTDHVTGLYNRRGFEEALATAIQKQEVDLLLIDLDHFKQINDKLGHTAGDQVLAEVGRRLRRQVRRDDIVARVGGDEFGIVLHGAGSDAASSIAERIVRELGSPYEINGQVTHLGASAGLSCSHGRTDAGELVAAADAALYAAKRAGRGQWRMAA